MHVFMQDNLGKAGVFFKTQLQINKLLWGTAGYRQWGPTESDTIEATHARQVERDVIKGFKCFQNNKKGQGAGSRKGLQE